MTNNALANSERALYPIKFTDCFNLRKMGSSHKSSYTDAFVLRICKFSDPK